MKGQKPSMTSESVARNPTNTSISATGDLSHSTTGGETEADDALIDVVHNMDLADQEALMNTRVKVMIQADDDPNAPMFIAAYHNGTAQYFQRGVWQEVKLRYLYSLLASKITRFSCHFGKDASGQEFNNMAGVNRTAYNLQIGPLTPEQRWIVDQANAERSQQ